jgi:hypothetical protein
VAFIDCTGPEQRASLSPGSTAGTSYQNDVEPSWWLKRFNSYCPVYMLYSQMILVLLLPTLAR